MTATRPLATGEPPPSARCTPGWSGARALRLGIWVAGVAVWGVMLASRAQGRGTPVLEVRGWEVAAERSWLLELHAPGGAVVWLPESVRFVGQTGTARRLAIPTERPGVCAFAVDGRCQAELDRPGMKALGLSPSAGGWLGLLSQVCPELGPTSTFFAILGPAAGTFGRCVALDQGAAELLRASHLDDGPATGDGPVYVSTDLGLLHRAVGRIADHPESNLIVCSAVPAIPGVGEVAADMKYMKLRLLAHDSTRAAAAMGQSPLLAAIAGVTAVLRAEQPSAKTLVLEAARCLAMQRCTAREALGRVQGGALAPEDIWAVTRVLGPAWHMHGSGAPDVPGLTVAVDRLWEELQIAVLQQGELDALPATVAIAGLDPPGLAVFSRYHGVIDDCGCKGVDSGGLARLAEDARDGLLGVPLVCAGGVFADLSSPRASKDSVSTIADLLRHLGERDAFAWNVDTQDLVAMVCSADLRASIGSLLQRTCLTTNVRSRAATASIGRRRSLTIGGERLEMLGLTGTARATFGRREALLLGRGYVIEDPVHCTVRELAALDIEDPTRSVGVALVVADLDLAALAACVRAAGQRLRFVLTSGAGDPIWLGGRLQARPAAVRLAGVPVFAHALSSKGVTCVVRSGVGEWSTVLRTVRRSITNPEVVALVHRESDMQIAHELLELQGWPVTAPAFVGSAACGGCHAVAQAQWQATPHATAFQTLVDMQRHHQGNCAVCHVTGYDGGGFQGRHGAVADGSRRFENVGCEVCHGPGGEHVTDPRSSRMVLPTLGTCVICHTTEHSAMNSSNASDYWREVCHR